MSDPRISIIAALSVQTRAIGRNNVLLWHLPGDLAHFKTLTLGHPIVMGKTTYESIGRPLPGRTNIVLSDDRAYAPEGVTVCRSLEEALALARSLDREEVFVIGGGSVYAQTIERADRLYLTLVDDPQEGDTHFPDYTRMPFKETAREEHAENNTHYAFVTLERIL